MASTFTAMSSVGSIVASNASISSSSFLSRRNVVLRRFRLPKISAAKELHFNKDGSAIKKLQTGVNKLADLVRVTLGPKGFVDYVRIRLLKQILKGNRIRYQISIVATMNLFRVECLFSLLINY
ncbi:hypothetical protein V6Z11_A10G157800 [Gossypium hirsutum]